jgi:TRAP-type mannitol/chloroaromatic compound transport system permease small subunit
MSRVVTIVDAVSAWTGHAVAWLTLGMVAGGFLIVVLRYAFDIGWIWMQESVTWMHAAVFMLGGASALQRDEHVRVDIFYRDMSPVGRARVDISGVLFFLFPLCAFISYESFDYVTASWAIGEGGRDAGGLPYPMIPLSKSILLLMPVLVALQGLSLLLESARTLRDGGPGGKETRP